MKRFSFPATSTVRVPFSRPNFEHVQAINDQLVSLAASMVNVTSVPVEIIDIDLQSSDQGGGVTRWTWDTGCIYWNGVFYFLQAGTLDVTSPNVLVFNIGSAALSDGPHNTASSKTSGFDGTHNMRIEDTLTAASAVSGGGTFDAGAIRVWTSGGWVTPTLGADFQNVGTVPVVKYMVKHGVLYIKGSFDPVTGGVHDLFTLPLKYRPDEHYFASIVNVNGDYGGITVYSDVGNVEAVYGASYNVNLGTVTIPLY
jgi:hypothetical protein